MSESATLVIGPSWVGDMVLAQSLFKLLVAREPDVALDVVAPDWSLPVVARMPEVRAGVPLASGHGELALATRRRTGQALRGRYDRAIVLPRSLKAALIPWFARIPVRTGYRGEFRYGLVNDMRAFDPVSLDQTIKRFLALGLPAGSGLPPPPEPALTVCKDNQAAFVANHGLDLRQPVIGLLPGAEFGPSKCWPVEHYAELATRLAGDGYQLWVFGSPKDAAAGERICELATGIRIRNLCGQTSLADAIDVLALTEQVVTNDSGLMHVAAAVGRHVHALYGATSPAFVAPLTQRKDIYFLDLDCSPCRQRTCPLGHHDCLRRILPADVHARVLKRREAAA